MCGGYKFKFCFFAQTQELVAKEWWQKNGGKQVIDKDMIIAKLREVLEPLPFIHAFWLEGADANGTADEYSDLDLWADVEDEYETQAIGAAESALASLSDFGLLYVMEHPHPKIRQRVYHLTDTSEYLAIDFCWQLHSREQVYLIEGDTSGAAKVVFDKSGVVRYKPPDLAEYAEENAKRLREIKYKRTQYARAEKYVRRGSYLEAYAYYNEYVLNPLVDLARLVFSPHNADFGFCHISRSVPEHIRRRLEYFAQIGSPEEIGRKITEAGQWFDTWIRELNL
jgi:hypothetical protein